MSSLDNIFQKEYESEVGNLYQVLSGSLLSSTNDEDKKLAKERFKAGLKIAKETYDIAVELSE